MENATEKEGMMTDERIKISKGSAPLRYWACVKLGAHVRVFPVRTDGDDHAAATPTMYPVTRRGMDEAMAETGRLNRMIAEGTRR